jgi:hypothetical protein
LQHCPRRVANLFAVLRPSDGLRLRFLPAHAVEIGDWLWNQYDDRWERLTRYQSRGGRRRFLVRSCDPEVECVGEEAANA